MADSAHDIEVAPLIQKLFLPNDSSDLRIEANAPNRPAVLVLVGVTAQGPRILASTSRKNATDKLALTLARTAIPGESALGSMDQAVLLDPDDISAPGVYAVVGIGQMDADSLVSRSWAGRPAAQRGLSPIGVSLSVEGATLVPDGVEWPMTSLVPDAFWAISCSSPSLLALCVINPGPNPDSDDAVFLVRRGQHVEIAAPTWTSMPGAPLMGVIYLPTLAPDPDTTVTVRRFLSSASAASTVTIQALSTGTTTTESLPTAIDMGGVSFATIRAEWRSDYTLKLSAET